MPYYPKSQIKNNLYTSGNEYSLTPQNYSSPQIPYIGPYYLLYNGAAFTGKTPSDALSQRLYIINVDLGTDHNNPYIEEPPYTVHTNFDQSDFNFINLTNPYNKIIGPNSPKERLLPYYNPTTPTEKDYQLGVFLRYFCKKNNEFKYIEIDKKIYNLLNSKSKNIAWDLYSPISTLWYLTGNKLDVTKTNKGLILQIERKQNWYGFSQYFKESFSKYYLGS